MMLIQRFLLMIVLLVGMGGVFTTSAQDEDNSKVIKAEVFIKGRPATKRVPSTARYKRVAKSIPEVKEIILPAGATFDQLGVTLWRFRRSTIADNTKELVEDDDGTPAEWTLERIEEGRALSPGEKVRLSVESLSRDGYLYAIDRELYSDGSLGDPLLIFPTRKSANANFVKAGHLIYLPSANGKFRIKPSASAKPHVGEVVTILVAPKPLVTDERLGQKAIKLSPLEVESWEQRWGGAVTKFEMDGGVGQAMTRREQTAASDSSQVLTQEDPVPQTVYRVASKPEDPIIIKVRLTFAASN